MKKRRFKIPERPLTGSQRRTAALLGDMRELFGETVDEPSSSVNREYSAADLFSLLTLGLLWGRTDIKSITEILQRREGLVRRMTGIPGIPAPSTFSERLDQLRADQVERFLQEFGERLAEMIRGLRGTPGKDARGGQAVDGKALRGGTDKKRGRKTPYIVNMFDTVLGIWMGVRHVVGKSNEKPAGSDLIAGSGEGGVVLSDAAFGTKKGVAAAVEAGKDYILAVKGCAGRIHKAIESFLLKAVRAYAGIHPLGGLPAGECPDMGWDGGTLRVLKERDSGHGRDMERYYFYFEGTGFLEGAGIDPGDYPGLESVAFVLRSRDVRAISGEREKRKKRKKKKDRKIMHVCYICSYKPGVAELARLVRQEWLIENSGHWVLDEVYREDRSTIRNEGMQFVMAVARRIAYNITAFVRECLGGKVPHARALRFLGERHLLSAQLVFGFVGDGEKEEVARIALRDELAVLATDLDIDPETAGRLWEGVSQGTGGF